MVSLDECLKGFSSAAIAGHIRPDGDSIGSCLAVYNYILDNYPDLRADIYLEPIPEKFSFLKNSDRILDPDTADVSKTYDVFFALDCGDAKRLGTSYEFFKSAKYRICVDHHLTNNSFADVNEVQPAASSTSELIYLMMDGEAITEPVAECLYLGIAHDTGIFQYSCTSPRTMQIAGALMAKGIPYPKIVDETYYIRSFSQQKIWGKALLDSCLCLGGKCIYSVITEKDMKHYHVMPEDLDGIVSELRSTSGVEVSVFLYETKDGFKISMRSAAYVDVAKIALEFGGGGHARAAGASGGKDPKAILNALLSLIGEQI